MAAPPRGCDVGWVAKKWPANMRLALCALLVALTLVREGDAHAGGGVAPVWQVPGLSCFGVVIGATSGVRVGVRGLPMCASLSRSPI